jgi:DNA-binding HxlR family transcriptional regulator
MIVPMRDERWSTGPCFIERSLTRIGDAWMLLILRDASRGLERFDEFRLSLGIAPNILTKKLGGLVDGGLLERIPYQPHPPRYRYVLTECGREFLPVLHVMGCWGKKHLRGENEAAFPQRPGVIVIDEETGAPVDTTKPIWP